MWKAFASFLSVAFVSLPAIAGDMEPISCDQSLIRVASSDACTVSASTNVKSHSYYTYGVKGVMDEGTSTYYIELYTTDKIWTDKSYRVKPKSGQEINDKLLNSISRYEGVTGVGHPSRRGLVQSVTYEFASTKCFRFYVPGPPMSDGIAYEYSGRFCRKNQSESLSEDEQSQLLSLIKISR